MNAIVQGVSICFLAAVLAFQVGMRLYDLAKRWNRRAVSSDRMLRGGAEQREPLASGGRRRRWFHSARV